MGLVGKTKRHLITALWWILGASTLFVVLLQLFAPIFSNDLWWQMAYGRLILEQGIPVVDHSIFSWTPAENTEIYNAWFSQILLYWIYDLFGVGGLLVFRFVVVGFVFYLAYTYAKYKNIHKHPLFWGVLMLAASYIWPKTVIKPELFSLFFMSLVVWLYYVLRSLGERAARYYYIFPLILVVWVNSHGAFFLSAPFFLVMLVGDWINKLTGSPYALSAHSRKHFYLAMLLCVGALLVNPYGYKLPLSIINNVIESAVVGMQNISDYLPTYIYNQRPYYLLDYLILGMVLFVLLMWQGFKEKKIDWVIVLSFIVYSAIYVQLIRVVHFLAPIFLFSALDMLSVKERSWFWRNQQASVFSAVVSLGIVSLVFVRFVNHSYCNLLNIGAYAPSVLDLRRTVAQDESNFIKQNLMQGKMGNVYSDGGELIYNLWPQQKVMIDPRAFPYRPWINEYFAALNGETRMEEFLNNYQVDFWLVNYSEAWFYKWLANSVEWRPVYYGPVGTIFVRKDFPYKGGVIYSDWLEGEFDKDRIGQRFMLAVHIKDLGFAKRLYQAALQNLGDRCDAPRFLKEMKEVLAAYEDFHLGNYEVAAKAFMKPRKHFSTYKMGVASYQKMGVEDFINKNYVASRRALIKSFEVAGDPSMLSLYNIMLADWYLHHEGEPPEAVNKDKYQWKKIAQHILDNGDRIPDSMKFIVDAASQVLEGKRPEGHMPVVEGY